MPALLHPALRPGIIVAIGQHDDANAGTDIMRDLQQAAAGDRFIIRMWSKYKHAIITAQIGFSLRVIALRVVASMSSGLAPMICVIRLALWICWIRV